MDPQLCSLKMTKSILYAYLVPGKQRFKIFYFFYRSVFLFCKFGYKAVRQDELSPRTSSRKHPD